MAFPANDRGQRCETGDVRTTAAGNLAAKFVVHAVGPFYNEKYSEKSHTQLRQVHLRALNEAIEHRCRSIAFPAISTGLIDSQSSMQPASLSIRCAVL